MLSGIKIFICGGDSSNCDGGERRKLASEVLYVFQSKSKKHFNHLTLLSSELLPAFPGFDVFGGAVNGKLVVGNRKSVLEYDIQENGWNLLQSTNKSRNAGSAMCSITDRNLILAGGETNGDTVEILQFYDYNNLNVSTTSYHQQKNPPLSGWSLCVTRLPILVSHHTLIKLHNKKVLLVGGIVDGLPSGRVFEGFLCDKEKDVMWKEAKSLKKSRQNHIHFKLGQNVYVAGGQGLNVHDIKVLSCCEVYNMESRKWVKSPHKLPYPLYGASVVVDPGETFALITGNFSAVTGASNRVIIFTEESGFVVYDKFSLKIPRFGHVSTRIE